MELNKPVTKEDMKRLLEGIELEDGPMHVDDIQYAAVGKTIDKRIVGVELHSGHNRIVRRLFEALGYEVHKLDRTTFAGLTADRKRGFVLVSDYRGKGPLTASVKGMDGARVLSAHVLDHTRDLEPVAVEWKDGTLSLPRMDENSAAFFVVFERAPGA